MMILFIYRDFETKEIHWSYSGPSDKEIARTKKGLINAYKINDFPKGPAFKMVNGAWTSATYQNPDSRKYQSLVDGNFVIRFKNQEMQQIEVFDGLKDWVPISEL